MNETFTIPIPRNEPVRSYAPGSPERASLKAKLHDLRSQTIEIPIIIDGRENVVAIPNGAVRRDSEGQYAYLSGADGPVRRAIRTGYRGSSYTEVLEGLDAGDTVILGSVRVGT